MAIHSSTITWKIPWTEELGRLQSMGFPRQEHWSGLPFLTLGHLPNPGIEPESFESPALADGLLTIVPTGTLTQT